MTTLERRLLRVLRTLLATRRASLAHPATVHDVECSKLRREEEAAVREGERVVKEAEKSQWVTN